MSIIESPIRYLYPYITGRFENTHADFADYAQQMINEWKIDQEISFEDTDVFDSPKTVFGKIILNKPFICSVWSFCYYYHVLHEEYVVPYYNEGKLNKNNILDQAESLYRWGKSLQGSFSQWPQGMPMPQQHNDNPTINIVNQIFLYAMDFIMCHEFAHIDKAPQQGTPIEQELEADDVAFDLLLKGCDGKNDTTIYLGIIMALATLLILNPKIEDSEFHPNSLSRLDAFVKKINLPETHTLWCILTIIIHDWNMRYDLGFDFPKESDTFKSRYEEMIEIINAQVSKNN